MNLHHLLPAEVICLESSQDDGVRGLYPEELAQVGNAIAARQAEFATGRRLAHEALARIGADPMPLLAGADRAPRWPQGVVGSLTHCAGYRAVAVAPAGLIDSVGIDAEPNLAVPAEVGASIVTAREREMLRELAEVSSGAYASAGIGSGAVAWDRLLFSAKESIFKAWFPLTGSWLDFTDCELSFDLASGSFHGKLSAAAAARLPEGCDGFEGRWLVRDSGTNPASGAGLILTAVSSQIPATA